MDLSEVYCLPKAVIVHLGWTIMPPLDDKPGDTQGLTTC